MPRKTAQQYPARSSSFKSMAVLHEREFVRSYQGQVTTRLRTLSIMRRCHRISFSSVKNIAQMHKQMEITRHNLRNSVRRKIKKRIAFLKAIATRKKANSSLPGQARIKDIDITCHITDSSCYLCEKDADVESHAANSQAFKHQQKCAARFSKAGRCVRETLQSIRILPLKRATERVLRAKIPKATLRHSGGQCRAQIQQSPQKTLLVAKNKYKLLPSIAQVFFPSVVPRLNKTLSTQVTPGCIPVSQPVEYSDASKHWWNDRAELHFITKNSSLSAFHCLYSLKARKQTIQIYRPYFFDDLVKRKNLLFDECLFRLAASKSLPNSKSLEPPVPNHLELSCAVLSSQGFCVMARVALTTKTKTYSLSQ
ncbi:hypothetical protein e1116g03.tmp0081 [Eimeria tenella]|uniref:Uncharacterized protein n=1 Tax=Eimeria tenella TaxID=5802 RepID=C8TE41_EIMTE|nr:hypothetical protein e1116g03.tmp0081 [Eimeria tenella]